MRRDSFSVPIALAVLALAAACPPGGPGSEGEGEGEGEGEPVDAGDCFPGVFATPLSTGPVVVYADGFRVGASAACPEGELYEVYFELDAEVPFSRVQASFAGGAVVDVEGVAADFDGHRGDACGPAVATSIQVGVQVTGEGGPSVPVCGTAF